jgi:protein TonB
MASFAGYTTNVGYETGTGTPTSTVPDTVKRSGDVIDFSFGTASTFGPGVVSPYLVVETNATTYAPGTVGVVGGVGDAGGAAGGVIGGVLGGVPGAPPPPPPPAPKKPTGPMRVGGQVAEANLIRKVQPTYPALAKSARVQGTVEFTAVISKEGNIENLQLVRGHPLLVNAARDAVLQWKYRPTQLNGQPVEVITDIIVNFTLSQ